MGLLHLVVRYWQTLRHLRPVQVYGRVWFRLWRPKPLLHPAPVRAKPTGPWQIPAKRFSSMTGPQSWLFLNEAGQLSEIGWDGPQREKLWRYNQHYFDDLNALGATNRLLWHTTLVEDWIMHNLPGKGIGWEPYPLSLRVVNWVKWALGGADLSEGAVQSLAVQVRWLTGRLEYHLLGNHLFTNAKALVMAGLFFEGSEADAWLAKGLSILAREIPEQILSDGGHFERSTMYHALALEDLLDLVNTTQRFVNRLSPAQRRQVASWPRCALALHTWLLTMCHPDGEISIFNDAALGIAPSMSELDAYARRVLVDMAPQALSSLVHLRESGYVRLACGPAVALLDVAPVGSDYLLGHAHADTLSFEFSLGNQRVLVNSGTSCYGSSAERLRQRGTAAHNTVVVNGQDSSEVWGGFRVARRAYPFGLQIQPLADATAFMVSCAHNGYIRLPGKPIHHRIWYVDAHGLRVTDQVEGPCQSAEARFHFHPAMQVKVASCQTEGSATMPDGTVITWKLDRGRARLESCNWHPRFGQSEPNVCMVVELVGNSSALHFRWGSVKA